MTVNYIYDFNRPNCASIVQGRLEGFTNPFEDLIPSSQSLQLWKWWNILGLKPTILKKCLHQRKYSQKMASSCVLQWKTLQGHGCKINPQPVSPVKDPVSKNDASAGPLRLKRSGSKSTLGTLVSPSSTGLVSAYGYKASQKEGRSATGPGLLLFGPLHMTPTQDKAYICARNVSYIHSTISLSKKTATLLLCHRRGQDCP